MQDFHIPQRFEGMADVLGSTGKAAGMLLRPNKDLEAIKRLVAGVRTGRQGKVLYLFGKPGVGKTSLAHSLPVFMSDFVGKAVDAPLDTELPLAELPRWIAKHCGRADDGRLTFVNVDSRERVAPDRVLAQTMTSLNGLLRRRPDLVILWPMTSQSAVDGAISYLKEAGAHSALAEPASHTVVGIERSEWPAALDLYLQAAGLRLTDAAISLDEVESMAERESNIGEYFRAVQNLAVARLDLSDMGVTLPILCVVVSAGNSDLHTNAQMIRRGDRYLLDADRVLNFSRSKRWKSLWQGRAAANPKFSFNYISSLFGLRLLHLSASAVVNACAANGSKDLQRKVSRHYQAHTANAANSLKNSSICRLIAGQGDVGSAAAGPLSDSVKNAYLALQAISQPNHDRINRAIMEALVRRVGIEELEEYELEYRPLHPIADLRSDVWVPKLEELGGRPLSLEFTHRRNATTANIASYVLEKVHSYAHDYGLL